MKLLRKYRRITYTSLCLVVMVGFIVNYYLFRSSIHRTTDDVLNEYRRDIEEYAEHHGTLQPLLAENSKFGDIVPANSDEDLCRLKATITDTMVYSNYQEERVVYRKIIFPIVTEKQSYVVRMMLPAFEEDDLVQTVVLSLVFLVTLFVLLTTFIDLSFTRQIFHPFHHILEGIKSYDLEQRGKIVFEESPIDEFRELGDILKEMMDKINTDYYEMREFLTYTSHEIQTPLSIIQLKLDVLSQQNFQDRHVIGCLQSIQSALHRVVRFNRSISFLAKIRNNQFSAHSEIDLRKYVHHHLYLYNELLSVRKITVSETAGQPFVLSLHPILGEHLVQNILTNAIKHNYDGGWIRIDSDGMEMVVTNTFDSEVPRGDIFEKYAHAYGKKGSTGLGLSIVKAICEKNNIGISYRISENVFSLTIIKQK